MHVCKYIHTYIHPCIYRHTSVQDYSNLVAQLVHPVVSRTLQHTATHPSRYMTTPPWSHCRCTHSTCMRSCVCMHVSLYVRMYIHVCTHIHTQVTSLTSAGKDTKISSYLNVCTYMYIHAHTHITSLTSAEKDTKISSRINTSAHYIYIHQTM